MIESEKIEPLCIHFGTCGGCKLQDISYTKQLELKQQSIIESLSPYISQDTSLNPIIGCEPPWQYRNKMEFTFSSDKAGNQYLGLIMKNGRGRVLNITECHLVNSWFVKALESIRDWWKNSDLKAFHPYRHTGSLRTLTVREGQRTGDRLVMLTVSGNPDYSLKNHHLDSFVETLKVAIGNIPVGANLSIFLRIQQAIKGMTTQFYEIKLHGPDHIREIMNIGDRTYTFRISPSAFFQPNTKQAEKLYNAALNLVHIPHDGVVYDLYCGTATLGICAAHKAKEVIGIEISPESVVDARENIKLNNINNVTILQGDVGKILSQRVEKGEKKPDLVIVDPPRVGLDQRAIDNILLLNPSHVLYISCNPTTQSVNLEVLKEGGYGLAAVQPVDQFPQTPHIENIVLLKKEKS